MKITLVIMAAGIGSRFGGGIKQLAPVGLNGEIIIDYSIHDAIEAGFNKIVFIIRKDIKDAFKEAIGDRIEKICKDLDVEIAYAYQELNELPEGVELPAGRTKPWGTGQAVLACKEVLHEPFAVINADDYYGKEAFGKLFGGWGLYEDGQFTTESIENFMLFVPFSILLLWAFQKELLDESENIRFGKTVWETTKVVAVFSFMIEFTQLLFHLGTFQISDLTYNTLGGAVGGVIYYLGYSRKRKK